MALRLDSEIMGTSRLSYRYQITVPKHVRERFDLKEEDKLIFVETDDVLFLRRNNK